jgi:hypothetical protein
MSPGIRRACWLSSYGPSTWVGSTSTWAGSHQRNNVPWTKRWSSFSGYSEVRTTRFTSRRHRNDADDKRRVTRPMTASHEPPSSGVSRSCDPFPNTRLRSRKRPKCGPGGRNACSRRPRRFRKGANQAFPRALCRTRTGDPFLTINARGVAGCCRLWNESAASRPFRACPIHVATEPRRRPVLPRCFHVAASNHARRRRLGGTVEIRGAAGTACRRALSPSSHGLRSRTCSRRCGPTAARRLRAGPR